MNRVRTALRSTALPPLMTAAAAVSFTAAVMLAYIAVHNHSAEAWMWAAAAIAVTVALFRGSVDVEEWQERREAETQ